MASKAFIAAAIILVILLATIAAPSSAMAKKYVVGDDSGWTVDFDYKGWAADKLFYVGDSLVFNYQKGAHNLIKVNGSEFEMCDIPVNAERLNTGNDVVILKDAGKTWYICGFEEHCSRGMKLMIHVLNVWTVPVSAPAPNPFPVIPGRWFDFIKF